MKKLLFTIIVLIFSSIAFSQALIDSDVLYDVTKKTHLRAVSQTSRSSLIVFLKSQLEMSSFLNELHNMPDVIAKPMHFMPAVAVVIPNDRTILNQIAAHDAVAQISLNKPASEELEVSAQAILLAPSAFSSDNNWWQAGYTGHLGVVGLIDSGIAVEHPGLANKALILDKEPQSDYLKYKNGVRTAHGTGVACIYAGSGSGSFPNDKGIAFGASTIVSGFADDENFQTTTRTLDWMLTRAPVKPTVINYSFGNGSIGCPSCTDWSGLAKVVDYVVNHEKILWVKSAGNQGLPKAPNQSTMSAPADNYNALTVANMNLTVKENGIARQTPDRRLHAIRYNSSRGPTLNGRRKPDITAPGNDTRTCAPDNTVYNLTYTSAMDYRDGYRLMGGTSSAAPHVGGSVLLLQDAGIKNPMAIKALLINSADAWTDSGVPGPDDPSHVYQGGHFAVMGSEWNPTYGWGYLNMQRAFEQRLNLIEDKLTLNQTVKEYEVDLPVGGKVTLVHERRVGYNPDNTEWRLSHLSLVLIDAKTKQLIAEDDSIIDTVHQVANCLKQAGAKDCSNKTRTIHAIARVTLMSSSIDGSDDEPFAISFG